MTEFSHSKTRTIFVVVTGDPLFDELIGPFKTERAARDVAARGSRGQKWEWSAVRLRAREGVTSLTGTAAVFRGFAPVGGEPDPAWSGGPIEPYFIGPFPDLNAARAWAIADGIGAGAAFEFVSLTHDDG